MTTVSAGAVKRPMAIQSRLETREVSDILGEGNSISSKVWRIWGGAPKRTRSPRISGHRIRC
ncbi:hypothetical protein C8R41DRAFT_371034 [Lentinula lateritia]|uniref:Uncharacterized protein n=1 Tax=Lentinula lateritia TaxID=40482 RepID=A0ABQ8VF08_9AGAR|nr:hypothetical protein C8R41DRAFT_371034 [Lentinula lateritia]